MTGKGQEEKPQSYEHVFYSYTTNLSQLEDENRILRETLATMKDELDRLRRPPLMVCDVKDIYGKHAIVRIPNGNLFYVNISSECEPLVPGDSVLAEQKNLTVLKKIDSSKTFDVERFVIIEKPQVGWEQVGGLGNQIREIQEVIELPLKKPQLFKDIGISPPKGVLLYGPPGTGKTLLAKAVAASTQSTFIQVVGSELVQKFIGEGSKLVKEIFDLARERAPTIIFIDELDAIAATRVDVGTSGEREVQRTFMQLLAEIDGFKPLDNVKIIGCTNRKEILDQAVVRPGRLDRLIKVELPDAVARKEILKIHAGGMRSKNLDLDALTKKTEHFSGAELRAVCTEAGYFAIRQNKKYVVQQDFLDAIIKVKKEEALGGKDYLNMFG